MNSKQHTPSYEELRQKAIEKIKKDAYCFCSCGKKLVMSWEGDLECPVVENKLHSMKHMKDWSKIRKEHENYGTWYELGMMDALMEFFNITEDELK